MTQATCIGTVKGPGETPNEFTLIAPDPERRVKHGEFLYYTAHVDGAARRILGRVTGRVSVQALPGQLYGGPGGLPRPDCGAVGL